MAKNGKRQGWSARTGKSDHLGPVRFFDTNYLTTTDLTLPGRDRSSWKINL